VAFFNFEFHSFVFRQRLEASALDCGMMYKHIGASVIWANKPVSLLVTKPLYFASWHKHRLLHRDCPGPNASHGRPQRCDPNAVSAIRQLSDQAVPVSIASERHEQRKRVREGKWRDSKPKRPESSWGEIGGIQCRAKLMGKKAQIGRPNARP